MNLLLLISFLASATPIYQMSTTDINIYLRDLHQHQPDFTGRLIQVAADSLGTPYARDPLGEGPQGKYDKDPLIDLSHVDCVTFIEQTVALASSQSYEEAAKKLQEIRYKNRQIAFESRNHFMIADWIANNHFCADISGKLGVPTETITRTMGRKYFYQAKEIPEFAAQAKDEKLTISYVPVAAAAQAESKLPSPALILLIGKVDWLFTLHCGLFIRDKSGAALFYNASSTEKKVVMQPFESVFANTTRYLGFAAYSISEPKF